MNRIASILAGTVTTTLSGAVVAAFAASQGILPSGHTDARATDATATATETTAVAAAVAPAATEASQQPQIVYVQKNPVVYTQDVTVPASNVKPSAETAQDPAKTPSPTSTPAKSEPAEPPAQFSAGSAPTQGASVPKTAVLPANPTAPANGGPQGAPMAPPTTGHSEDDKSAKKTTGSTSTGSTIGTSSGATTTHHSDDHRGGDD